MMAMMTTSLLMMMTVAEMMLMHLKRSTASQEHPEPSRSRPQPKAKGHAGGDHESAGSWGFGDDVKP
jgi:hypothetical protein